MISDDGETKISLQVRSSPTYFIDTNSMLYQKKQKKYGEINILNDNEDRLTP